jgi:hypothetical protein
MWPALAIFSCERHVTALDEYQAVSLSLKCGRPSVNSSGPVSDLSYWLACSLCKCRVGPRSTGGTVMGYTALHTVHSRGDLLE